MAVDIRRVAYSHARGTFLHHNGTGPVWSKDPGVLPGDNATTFADRTQWDSFVQEKQFLAPGDVVLAEVWPHGPGATATVEDIANAGLPRWGN